MRLARTIWLFSRRDRPGQGMVEFALVAPLFLLFVFGIIQVALLYFVNSALAQAATDGSHVVSAQSSSGPLDLNGDPDQTKFLESWQGDGPALSYIQAAMASQNLNNIQQIDIFPADVNGKAVQVTINASQDLPIASTQTLMLVNQYRLY
ncbi:MAG: hypothetical protein JWO42_3844, partial [Chloroflexi bacterium]|nr:hypothetical protein [Chloroflexota bacterium]